MPEFLVSRLSLPKTIGVYQFTLDVKPNGIYLYDSNNSSRGVGIVQQLEPHGRLVDEREIEAQCKSLDDEYVLTIVGAAETVVPSSDEDDF